MRAETRLRFPWPFHKHDELDELRTRKQIALFVARESARRARVERRAAEARVRHLNLDLFARVVLLVLAIGIGVSVIVGSLGNPAALKLTLLAAGTWGTVAAALHGLLRPGSSELSKKGDPRRQPDV